MGKWKVMVPLALALVIASLVTIFCVQMVKGPGSSERNGKSGHRGRVCCSGCGRFAVGDKTCA